MSAPGGVAKVAHHFVSDGSRQDALIKTQDPTRTILLDAELVVR